MLGDVTEFDLASVFDGLDVGYERPDGYTYASFALQGVRTYDSTSQQWLTPDAFAGDVNDPMSQKPFLWNANKPLTWSDPSGYDSWPDSVTNYFDTEPVIPSDVAVVSGGDYGNLTAYVPHSNALDQNGGFIFGDQFGPNQLVNIPSLENETHPNGSEQVDYIYKAFNAFNNVASDNAAIIEHISGYFPGGLDTATIPINLTNGAIADTAGSGRGLTNGHYTFTQTFTEQLTSGGYPFTGGSLTTVFIHTWDVVNGKVTNIQFSVQTP